MVSSADYVEIAPSRWKRANKPHAVSLEDLRHIRGNGLLAELEFCLNELPEVEPSQYREYLSQRIALIRAEIQRRRVQPSKPRFRGKVASEVKARLTTADFINLIGNKVEIYHNGKGWRYRCPVHGDGYDRDPSGVIYPDEKRWWCFGCNSGGDCFDFLMAFPPHLSFMEAVERVASAIGMEIPDTRPKKGGWRNGFATVRE